MKSNIGTGTKKIFYDDAYEKYFEANVISCEACEKGYEIILNQTAFFPEEGGQSPDTGFLKTAEGKEVEVKDVQIKDGIIYHYTDEPIEEDLVVSGEIDFARRFSNMQNHSAEHLFSGLVCETFGAENVGFHLSDNEVTADYDKAISEEDLAEIERKVNEIIQKNIETSQWFPDEDELADIDFRSKKDIKGQVRLIVFPGVDICACCAPHVANTGEIGLFKIVSVQSHRGGVRVSMLAGMRAFDYLKQVYDAMMDTSRFMTTSFTEVRQRVEALKDENFETKGRLAELQTQSLKEELLKKSESKKQIAFVDGLDMNIIRKCASEIYESRGGMVAIFSKAKEAYQYIVIADGDVSIYQKELAKLGAKGGGRAPAIQGTVDAIEEDIKKWFDKIELT